MTPEAMARLHALCFERPRPWSAAAFAAVAADRHSLVLTRPDALLVGRAVADEAELLTLAVAPDARRRGLARDLMSDFAASSRTRGALRAYLEVRADNGPALALYRAMGWTRAGERRDYLGPGHDAVTMMLDLASVQQGG